MPILVSLIMIAADAAHFGERTLRAAVAQLRPDFAVSGGRLYQFADVSPAKVIIEWLTLTSKDLWIGLVAGGIIEAVKRFLKPKGVDKTIFEFKVKGPQQTTMGHLETSDAGLAKEALIAFHDVAMQRKDKMYAFDTEGRRWVLSSKSASSNSQPLNEATTFQADE